MRAVRLALALALALASGGCATTKREVAVEPPLVIPKLPSGAGEARGPSPRREPGAGGKGWVLLPQKGMPESVDRGEALDMIRGAEHRAVVTFVRRVDECSSAGGTRLFFQLIHPGRGVAQFGGHGIMLPPGFDNGQAWVAAVEPLGTTLSAEAAAFCVPNLYFDTLILALVPVTDQEEGIRLLDEIGP